MNFGNSLCKALQNRKFLFYSVEITRNYAKPAATAVVTKKKVKVGSMVEKKQIPVETDVKKLLSHCCGSNIMKDGEDVKLKPDEEYPDWLWNLHTGPPLTLEEMDPNSKQYWLKIRKIGMRRNNQLAKIKKF